MKYFKKKIMAGMLMAAMIVCTLVSVTPAGAATLTAKQYLTKMEKVAAKAKSYELSQTMTVKSISEGQTSSVKTTAKSITFQNPIKSKTVQTMTMKGDGVDSTSKIVSYTKEDSDGKIYQYTSVDGGEYTQLDLTKVYEESESFDIDSYSDAKIVKKSVKVNKVDTVKISANMKGDALVSLLASLSSSPEDLAELGVDMNSLAPVKVTVWIDKKTYYPVKVTTDLKNFYNSYLSAVYEALGMEPEGSYSVAKGTTTYKNFNKATKISFPKF